MFLGTACRARATVGLAKLFSTPLKAQQYYSRPMESHLEKPKRKTRLHSREVSTQTTCDTSSLYKQMELCVLMLPECERLSAVTKLLKAVSARSITNIPVTIPDDFLLFALNAMSHLKQSGRSNIVYGLVRGLGQMRADGRDSKLPTLQMPMGLLEYVISFYSSDTLNQVSYETEHHNGCVCVGKLHMCVYVCVCCVK